MSGYKKSPGNEFSEFDTQGQAQAVAGLTDGNPGQPSGVHYALPGLASAQLQSSSTSYDRYADQVAYGASSNFQPQVAYHAHEPAYDFGSRKILRILSYSPSTGSDGTTIYVYIESNVDLIGASPTAASLMFANCRVTASLQLLEAQAHEGCHQYAVVGSAPSFSDTASSSNPVALGLQLQETSAIDAGLYSVGSWLYEDSKQREKSSSPELARKRKLTLESSDPAPMPKRFSPSPFLKMEPQDYGSYPYSSDTSSTYPQSLHSIDLSTMQRRLTPYGRMQSQQMIQEDPADLSFHDASASTSTAQSLLMPPTTSTSTYSPSHSPTTRSNKSPVPPFRMSASSSPNPPNLSLMRATELQRRTGSSSASAASSSDGNLNPFYSNKANISIRGNLDTMQENWTPEERSAKRRLVRFRGEQVGSTVNTYFKAVKSKPDGRNSSRESRERLISCIYWEERDEYYVTSVDTIALLETLVGARFQVEEKNRIRRNLETHHPLTVSKSKPEFEDFFRVIMAFDKPKPRNIEKDVKVFPWPILTQALKKVFSKYSASPASVHGPMTSSRVSRYSLDLSDASGERLPLLTRTNTATSSSSSSFAHSLKASTLSPPTMSHTMRTQYTHQPSPATSLSHAYTVPTLASHYGPFDSRSSLGSFYNPQVSIGDSPQPYVMSSRNRRRSSDVTSTDTSYPLYAPRPRANTSFSALYQATQQEGDYSQQIGQAPSGVQPARGSWDINAYLHNEPESMSQGAVGYNIPSRQGSTSSQYHQ